jgi:glutamate dehydrogenase (NADP+)
MTQNAARDRWDFDQSELRLHRIMRDVHDATYAASERYGRPGDYVLGANSAGFVTVAQAMIDQGVV